MSRYQFETERVHAGYYPAEHFNAVNPPIYQTAAFELNDIDRARRLWTGAEGGGIYSRVGNPTGGILEQRIAELDGGTAATAVTSGMTAIAYVVLCLGRAAAISYRPHHYMELPRNLLLTFILSSTSQPNS